MKSNSTFQNKILRIHLSVSSILVDTVTPITTPELTGNKTYIASHNKHRKVKQIMHFMYDAHYHIPCWKLPQLCCINPHHLAQCEMLKCQLHTA